MRRMLSLTRMMPFTLFEHAPTCGKPDLWGLFGSTLEKGAVAWHSIGGPQFVEELLVPGGGPLDEF